MKKKLLEGSCHGLTPAGSSAPDSRLLTPPHGMEQRTGRVKVRKFVGWHKDGLTGKARPMHTSEAKQEIHALLPIGRQVFSHLQERRAPSRVTVTWEDKRHHS